jgi:outer membrane protein TolC
VRLTTTRALTGCLAALLLTGCQSYERQPLNLDEHRGVWLDRSPDSQTVQEFAHRLAEEDRLIVPFDPSDGVTVREAEVIALVYNPDLRLARARADVAAATAENAGLWEDPVFQIDVLRITESVSNPWVVTPGLALTIPISGRLEAERDRASASLRSELARIAEAEWRVRTEVRQAWSSWTAAQMSLEVTTDLLAQLQSLVASTEQLADAGELVRTESALFRIEQAQLRTERRHIEGEIAEGEQLLRSLLGLAPNAPIELIPSLNNVDPTTSDSEAVADRNPTLTRLREDYEVAEQSLRREILKQYPDLTIGPLYESDQGQSRIGLLGAIPLPILNANRQGIAEAEAERSLARAAFETAYERLMGSLAAAQARLDASRDQREELEHVVIPLVDQQVLDARQLLELGEGGALVLLESITRAHDTKLQLLDLRLREATTEAELTWLIGPEITPTNPAADQGSEVEL